MAKVGLPSPAHAPAWSKLVGHYRHCLRLEQMARLQSVLEAGSQAHLPGLVDCLISELTLEQTVENPSHIQQIRQLMARRSNEEPEVVCYGYPLVRRGQSLSPLCYVPVTVEAGAATGTAVLKRSTYDISPHPRFFRHEANLTDQQISRLVTELRERRPLTESELSQPLLPEDLVFQPLLFLLARDSMTVGLDKDLKWLGQQPGSKLAETLRIYVGQQPPRDQTPCHDFCTPVFSNPAQNRVLRERNRQLQVVAGPPGTGKTQTIINLIASTVADGQSVLFISKNNEAVDNVVTDLLDKEIFPGALRLGKVLRKDYWRSVQQRLDKLMAIPPGREGDLAHLRSESNRLGARVSALEEEFTSVEQLTAVRDEMRRLQTQAGENVKALPIYGWVMERAALITATNAHIFSADQMSSLRQISAWLATWDTDTSWLTRLLNMIGLLEPLRRRDLQRRMGSLPILGLVCREQLTLALQVNEFLTAELAYPYLFARARLIAAEQRLAQHRPLDQIKGELGSLSNAKCENDKKLLRELWAQLVESVCSNAQPLKTALEREQTPSGRTVPQWADDFRSILACLPVICCTNLSLGNWVPNVKELFDLVILDEASQSDIASFLPALHRAKRACVVGDDQQLRHISKVEQRDEEAVLEGVGVAHAESLRYSTRSAFDRARDVVGQRSVRLLDRHYRCIPEIIQFCNAEFYGGQLRIERPDPEGPSTLQGLPTHGFQIDDVASGTTNYPATLEGKPANEDEARRVVLLAQRYIELGWTDVGVVTPFRGQKLLLDKVFRQAAFASPDLRIRDGLKSVKVGTIHTFQGGQKQIMLFSTVVAPGARSTTAGWFSENKNLVNVAISRARDLLVVVCHEETLRSSGGILESMVEYSRGRTKQSEQSSLPSGLHPERFGLQANENSVLADWLGPATVLQVLNPGEKQLYDRLRELVGDRPIWLSPKMRVIDAIDIEKTPGLDQKEKDYAFRSHFDVVLVDSSTFHPLAAVELDGRHHSTDPLTQARDRLKDSLCHKSRLPIIRVRWGEWGSVAALEPLLRDQKTLRSQ